MSAELFRDGHSESLFELREENRMPEIVAIKGVGPVLAKACIEQGYGSVEKIAAAMVVELVAVPGVSEIRANQLIDAAKSLLNGGSPVNAIRVSEPNADPESKPDKKAGSDKIKAKNKNKSKKEKSNKKTKKDKKKKIKKKKKNKKEKK